MKKRKKIIVAFILIALVIFTLIILNGKNSYQHMIYVNWGVDFYKPDKLEPIFMYDYREGEDFIIASYDNDKFNKTLSKNDFSLIDTKNVYYVREYLTEFYSRLDSKEKELFDKNVKIDSLINQNNYYLYKDKVSEYLGWENRNFVIIIADSKTKKLYYFNAIW